VKNYASVLWIYETQGFFRGFSLFAAQFLWKFDGLRDDEAMQLIDIQGAAINIFETTHSEASLFCGLHKRLYTK